DTLFNTHAFYTKQVKQKTIIQINEAAFSLEFGSCGKGFEVLQSNEVIKPDIRLNTQANSDVVLTSLYGSESTTLDQILREDKLSYVDFWGTWCSYCVKYLPYSDSISSFQQANLIYVNFGDEITTARKFVEDYGMKGRHYYMKVTDQSKMGITQFPGGLLIDKDKSVLTINLDPKRALNFFKQTNNYQYGE
ncbi:MAG: hypothetical protein WBA74_07300, partial [Cyclobacteriaceae bacterium]